MAETSSIDGRRGKRLVFALSLIKTDIESAIVGADRMKKSHEIIFLLFNLLNFVPKNDH